MCLWTKNKPREYHRFQFDLLVAAPAISLSIDVIVLNCQFSVQSCKDTLGKNPIIFDESPFGTLLLNFSCVSDVQVIGHLSSPLHEAGALWLSVVVTP